MILNGFRKISLVLVFLYVAAVSLMAAIGPGEEALKLLKEGNERFVMGKPVVKDISAQKRMLLSGGQKPLAYILSCSDSRVPPEIIFDQGLGDLFVIRVAGNVSDTIALGTIEYAAEHFHTSLLVVLGHSNCGAIKAAIEGGEFSPNVGAVIAKIAPAVKIAKARNVDEKDIIRDAVVENVRDVIKDIRSNSPVIKEMEEKGKMKIIGAVYDLESGKVQFLKEDH